MQLKHIFQTTVLAAALITTGAGCSNSDSDSDKDTSAPTPAAVAPVPVVSFEATPGVVKEFKITAKDWDFTPGTITVKKGDKVRLIVTSTDIEHGIAIRDYGINVKLMPNKPETIEFVADKAGTFSFNCSVPCGEGHREMKGVFIVE